MSVALAVGTAAAIGLAWLIQLAGLGGGTASTTIQTLAYLALLYLALRHPRAKARVVRVAQRYLINPITGTLFRLGLNPLGLAILETTGRRTGRRRRVPIGNGLSGNDFWIIAEHGLHAGYVQNILAEPRVRVRFRRGLHYVWSDGVATVRADDDPFARQRSICARHPLRILNAMTVRVLAAEPVTVHIRLTTGARRAAPT